ncbi:MAG TPA: acetylornithine transaminase [Beutenbergiaceae bacterium]|nr:acetylornithine transaminase [Beutenbergiaceae bacterium]
MTTQHEHPDWRSRYADALMNTFGPPQRVLVRGEGAYVWDNQDRRYLDLLGGIAVNALGHAHPALVDAVSTQVRTLGHVSNFFATPAQIALAEQLLELCLPAGVPHGSGVFFTNSGTEAMEAAVKLARLHGGPERPRILALEGAFHGRTLGALALTHKPAYRDPFAPLPGGVEHLPFGDVDALRAAFAAGGEKVAAMVVEPIQGEAGVRPLPEGYLAEARRLTSEYGALLILDEIQSGIARTGRWLAHHHDHVGGGITPDAIALAKGLGGGFPIGALVGVGEAGQTYTPGQHGTTFGGNPMAAAAALATLEEIERANLCEHVQHLSARWRTDLAAVDHPLLAGVRGEGLLLAVTLGRPVAAPAAQAALEAGFIVNPVAPDALRLAPPLIIDQEQANTFTRALPQILTAAEESA